jgi:hypothetical protein
VDEADSPTEDVEVPVDEEVLEGVEPKEEMRFDLKAPGEEPEMAGIEPTQRERLEAGLQDSLDLREWRMPRFMDYYWYIVVYGALIALSVYVVVSYQALWAYVLWGGYLVVLVILATLIVRSLSYRRQSYSKSYCVATLDLQNSVEDAIDDVGLSVDYVDKPRGTFLRPIIAVYRISGKDYTVSVEGKSHLERKVVRVGRLKGLDLQREGLMLCHALDDKLENVCRRKRTRSLFKEGPV